MTNRVHLITLGVQDMKVSRAYYESMGWVASPISMDEITFFQSGQQVLGLYLQATLDHDTGLSGGKPGGVTLATNTQSRGEVEALMKQAQEAGATVLKQPIEMPWGGYVGYIADPDGHPWEFSYVEQLVPNEDGALILPDSL
ncbi:MAG: VOC family protein [Magnetovibrio sp.]|nr:VOC family protein [Magnetovibrio sp.]